MSIPRLKLLAALISIRMATLIQPQLDIPLKQIKIFSDSQIALCYIHSAEPVELFVKNVVKIKEMLSCLTTATNFIMSHLPKISPIMLLVA